MGSEKEAREFTKYFNSLTKKHEFCAEAQKDFYGTGTMTLVSAEDYQAVLKERDELKNFIEKLKVESHE